MLFLMNDVLLDLGGKSAAEALDPLRVRALTLADVLKLGAELYAEEPLLHREEPERARRLAILMRAKAPELNAALFVAPARDCEPASVERRVAEVSGEVMAELDARARCGKLDVAAADRRVWRRLDA